MNAKFLARLLPSVQRDIFLPCSYVNAFWFGDASLSLGNVKTYYTLWPDVKTKQCGFFVCSFVYLCGHLFVCVSYFFPLFVFQFLCFMMIGDTYALAIYTSRGASLKQKECGVLCLFVCLFVWSLVCLCVLLFFLCLFSSFFVL